MSKLVGHYVITVEAIGRLQRENPFDAVIQRMFYDRETFAVEKGRRVINRDSEFNLQVSGVARHLSGRVTRDPAWGSVMRDIRDTFNGQEGIMSGGHLESFAQKHHFMRRFDGQSPYQAYLDGVRWIKQESNRAVYHLHAALGLAQCRLPVKRGERSRGPLQAHAILPDLFRGIVSDRLGAAIHCLQDTFSPAHVVRDRLKEELIPGKIVHVKVYRGHEEEGHSHDDQEWSRDDGKQFSATGEVAVQATAALMKLIITSASQYECIPRAKWRSFRNLWLEASDQLRANSHWDFALDFIERFESGFTIPLKAMEIAVFKSWAMDEDGMAEALINELDSDLERVYQVIHRLNKLHYTDADDVSVLYVEKIRKYQRTSIIQALRQPQNRKLIDLMIDILEDGPTWPDERSAINYLKSLRS